MTQYYVKIDGNIVSNVKDAKLNRSWKGNNKSTITVAYGDGSFYDTLKFGQEVEFFRTSDDKKVWGGIVVNIDREIKKIKTLKITIGDYTEVLKKILVTETYRNQVLTDIVSDLATKYLPDGYTATKIQTDPKTLEYINFKRKPLYDCLRDLAKYLDWIFYIDVDKDLNFAEGGATFSGVTLTSGSNLKYISEKQDVSRLVNKVRVVGGFRNVGTIELFSGDGTTLIFTTQYKPISVTVEEYIGTEWVVKKGYAKNATSDYDYDIDAEAHQIIFADGKAPASGTDNVRITYTYGVPIIVEGESSQSQTDYNILSEADFEDKTILQRGEAVDLVNKALEKYKNPLYIYDCYVKGIEPNIDIGETVRIVNTNNNIDTYKIVISIDYHIIGRKLETKIGVTETKQNFNELMRGILLDLNDLKTSKMEATEIVTKLLNFSDNIYIQDNNTDAIKIYKRSIAGDTLIWGSINYGIWGTNKWGQRASFILGTLNATLGTSKLGGVLGSYTRVV